MIDRNPLSLEEFNNRCWEQFKQYSEQWQWITNEQLYMVHGTQNENKLDSYNYPS